MIDLNDAKTLVSAYKFIERTCEAINEFIYKHAVNYGPDPETTTTYDVLNNIINLMERKNKLINLKNIIDEIIQHMSVMDRQILILKMRYRPSIKTIQRVLNISSERTTFRRVDNAMLNFAKNLKKSINAEKVKAIMESENWIVKIRESLEPMIVETKAEVNIGV